MEESIEEFKLCWFTPNFKIQEGEKKAQREENWAISIHRRFKRLKHRHRSDFEPHRQNKKNFVH